MLKYKSEFAITFLPFTRKRKWLFFELAGLLAQPFLIAFPFFNSGKRIKNFPFPPWAD
jgi:hypothetical protein